MFGMSGTELAIILILALLLLGPSKLPELARSVGKGLREFRRATDDIRHSVESEFYRMDMPPPPPRPDGAPVPVTGALPAAATPASSATVPTTATVTAASPAAPASAAGAASAPAAKPEAAAAAASNAPPREGGTT